MGHPDGAHTHGHGFSLRGIAALGLGVLAVIAALWLWARLYWLIGIAAGIVVATAVIYWRLVRHWDRRGVIMTGRFAELHAQQQAQLPQQAPAAAIGGGVHLHLYGPEGIELARQIVEGQRAALPAPIRKL